MFEIVEEFNKEIIGIDRNEPKQLDTKEFKWLIGALNEEIEELEEATTIVDQVDALMDLIYFACGGLTRMGLPHKMSKDIFEQVHLANMQKAKGKKEGRTVEFELDASKPDGWQPPEARIKAIMGV